MNILKNNQDLSYIIIQNKNDQRHILWELEGFCNLHCKYCYDTRAKNNRIGFKRVQDLVRNINQSEFDVVHITGGEPTLNPYLPYIIKGLKNKKICITTNLVSNNEMLERIMHSNSIYSISVSLDSLNPKENDYLRGETLTVLKNLQWLIEMKQKNKLTFKIRIHCVISKVNLDSIADLLDWAKDLGIDEVSCQPIDISVSHPYYSHLSLNQTHLSKIKEVLSKESKLFDSQYSLSHNKLIDYYLSHSSSYIETNSSLCDLFIDANGEVWNCPCKIYRVDEIALQNSHPQCCDFRPQCMTGIKRQLIKEVLK